jgi:hypothetical protein
MFDKRKFAGLTQALPTSGSRQRFVPSLLVASVIVLAVTSTGAKRRALAQNNQALNPCTELRGLKNANLTVLQGQAASLQIRESHPNLQLSQDALGRKLTIGINNATATEYQIVIDDSASFHQPILSRRVTGSNATFDTLESGLSPGVPYYLSITPGALRAQFSLRQPSAASDLPANYLKNAWQSEGRRWVARHTGVNWNTGKGLWEINPKWAYAEHDVAQQAYYAPYALRGAVNQALVNHDLQLMDELAQFYMVYLQRFTILGEMRRQKGGSISTDLLLNQGADSSRTLQWLEPGKEKKRMRESVTATVQFLHPTARLIRIITTLPPAEQSPRMRQFVAAYYPLILRDQVLRLAYVAHWDYWKTKELPRELINIWKAILQASSRPKISYQHGMFDRDLWLIAIAAELLGANANAPQLAPLAAHESAQLREITSIGVQLFQKKRTLYADTKNFAGQVVQSASYFNGDMDDHPDMAYVGYEGESFPKPEDKNPARGVSWDTSHFHRVPVFLRALYDNRKATKLSFPQAHDMQLVANQFVYKVFQGDFRRPLFSNFFDGSDGWYRVNYQGRASAYPPSCACNSADKPNLRLCLTSGAIQGWSQMSFFNNDLLKLQRALTLLAASNDAEAINFRKRFYTYSNQEFAFKNSKDEAAYPILLYALLAELPE